MTRDIKDKKELYKLISYLVMGDGGVYKNGGPKSGARFILVQREDHLDFVTYAADIINNVTSCSIKHVDRSKDTDANRRDQLRLESKTHPIFSHMREHIYTDLYKGICPHYLKMLDWESLAILYMSDGYIQRYIRPEVGMKNPSYSLTLNMKRLSYGDQVLLKRALEEKGMGIWNVVKQSQYYSLRLRNKFLSLFMSNIESYIVPSYEYKLISDCRMISPSQEEGGDIV
jgi:hypothetical protein